ncbi:dephospho-CoA kinase [uncultured Enterovirga sp.]|uniref:dephospho-CoA kinase n=1 Tax=uncultured Enterovirga sp. TaxID=2026352 RepID=UPI0035CB84BF
MTFVLGLTGSIGMGKSTTGAMFRNRGVPVHDADGAVHALYRGKAASLIEAAFPGTVQDGVVDRARLGAIVLGSTEQLRNLEGIVHPLVRAAEQAFLDRAVRSRAPIAILDIPLLIESGGMNRVDAVLVVTARAEIQRDRVLARPGMDQAKFVAILARQVPDREKRARSHFLVDTGHGLHRAEAQVGDILRAIAGRDGRVAATIRDTRPDRPA